MNLRFSTRKRSNSRGPIFLALGSVVFTGMLLAGCPSSTTDCQESSNCLESSVTKSFDFEGYRRSYTLHVPTCYDGTSPAPVVFVLHGLGQSIDEIRYYTGFDRISDRFGFIPVYPEAYLGNWNDGRAVKGITAYDDNINDVGFILAVLARVGAEYNIDIERIYATGMSAGGMMTQRLGIEGGEWFAAIAPVVGAIPENLTEDMAVPVPLSVMMINGTDDPLIPWEGGVLNPSEPLGTVLSVADATGFWIAVNGCSYTAEIEELPNLELLDITKVVRQTFSGGTDGTEVILYSVNNGGHAWPGAPVLPVIYEDGLVSQDLDASNAIWSFFAQHTRPIN